VEQRKNEQMLSDLSPQSVPLLGSSLLAPRGRSKNPTPGFLTIYKKPVLEHRLFFVSSVDSDGTELRVAIWDVSNEN
jgi:hypothetical protein